MTASVVAAVERECEVVRPPLKWAGGKRWLVTHLRDLWADHSAKRLVEPFCGGLAVTLGLKPDRALLNDINLHTINFYRWLRKGLTISITMENQASPYYSHRKRFNELAREGAANTAEAAALFYYLNRTGYNGLCRFNSEGHFNVPFGNHKKINYQRDFKAYKELFAGWGFSCGDFGKIKLEADDFIYADPPYDVEFTQYSSENFTWRDQIRLAVWLARHPGPVVLSNQATDRVVELYHELGFQLRLVDAPRMISCTGDRTRAREILATRNL
jgi:DNA adenine methylase